MCANGLLQIIFYNSQVVRLRYTPTTFGADFSYAVTLQPQPVTISAQESEHEIHLYTESVVVAISKPTGAVTFYNQQRQLLCAQDPMGVCYIGEQVSVYHTLQNNERFIGLGEKTGNLNRRGSAYVHWNTDYFGYPENADPLYCSTPFYIGLHSGVQYGIFLDNTHRSVFNFGASNHRFSSISADAGEMNYYFIAGDNVPGIISHYTALTGRMPLPPKWSLGFQQCRYSYYPDTEVLRIANTFREKQIPCDVMYLDIHYMDAYKCFTFDKERFSQPDKMVNELKALGFQTTVILDPGVKTETGYDVYDSGNKADVFVKYADGTTYECSVWPGRSAMPDFTAPHTRQWWKEWMKFYTSKGIRGFWNDMNEPASWGQCTPDNTVFAFDGNTTTHREARNVYGMQMARSTYEGAREQLHNERPFILTRAGFSGIQRYAAVWTGDNLASDEHMLLGVRLVNSLGLSGVPFAGVDVGGFSGTTTPALFARWISVAAFSPFFRVHKMINAISSEPWSYGEEVTDIARNYISLRYRLMPYLYSLFYEASQTGVPVVRSLAMLYPHSDEVYAPDFQNQFMLGSYLLVCPCSSAQRITKVFLPEGEWYDLYNDKKYSAGIHLIEAPLERLPVFVKAGAVIPMQSLVQSLQHKPADTLEIHTYAGADSSFVYYEDDGITFDYEKGKCLQRTLSFYQNELAVETPVGHFASAFSKAKVYAHGSHTPANDTYRFVEPISNFDPFYSGNSSPEHCKVVSNSIAW